MQASRGRPIDRVVKRKNTSERLKSRQDRAALK